MNPVRVSAKAIILHDNKFLILKDVEGGNAYWDLPGGKIEYGENPEQTVVREVKEETMLDITVNKLLGICWFFNPVKQHQVICITYVCTPSNTEVDLTKNPAEETITEYKWITKEEFLEDIEFAEMNPSIKELMSKL